MVNCREFSERVTEYLDGGMPLLRRSGYALHLATCSGCRAHVQHMRLTVRALENLPREPAPRSTRDELRERFRSAYPARADAGGEAWLTHVLGLVRGRRAWLLVLLALSVPVLVLAASGAEMGAAGHGAMCLGMELMVGAGSFASLLFISRRARLDAASFAAVAAVGALVGYVPAELACDMRQAVAHVIVFHVGGIALAAMMGFGAGRLVVAR